MTIGFIGLGGAGGNVANEAALLGIHAAAINFSQKDLDSIEHVKMKLKIMGSDGVGHDRNLAINLVQDHHQMILKFISDNFSSPSIQIIFIPFACGGGSGSGIAPILCDILSHEMPDKVIVPMPIIADESEVLISQMNCYNSLVELSKLDLCILPIDNQKVKTNFQAYKSKVFEIANTTSVSLIHSLVEYTNKSSKNGNFDNKDLISVFSQRGIGCIAETEIVTLPKSDITKHGIASSINSSWENSIFAPIEYDQVAKCGFIFDGQESLIEHIDYDLVFNSFSHGVPIDLFEGYYGEHNGKIITILTGLSWCNSRMRNIDVLIENEKNKAEMVIKSMENDQFKAKTFDFDQKLRQNNQKTSKNVAVLDIIGKYKR